MQTLPACDLPGQLQNFDFGWEQNVCSNQYSPPWNISSVSLVLSYTSNTRPNSVLSYLPRGAVRVSQLKSKHQACEWGPGFLRKVKILPQSASYPPALPLANLWPHQGPESKGDLGVSPGLTWYSLLQSAKSQKHHLWEVEVCVSQGLSLPTVSPSLGLSNVPRAKKSKNYLLNLSSHESSSSVWFGDTGLWSLLTPSEVGWTKSIAGLCPQLLGNSCL